ncbi:MAG: patatin-like phospholipase family protein [Tissierellia bacterium]|nr:patatin-like phospholipase family protein [Tissierellia bacterium]
MIGLVLEGGGARGSYHMGVYKAILEEGIEINGITGTSIGGLNAAMIVQGDFDICCKLWENISYSMIVDLKEEEVDRLYRLNFNNDIRTLIEKLKIIISEGGLDITPLRELIDRYIDEDRIRSSPMDFGLVTVNLTDRKVQELFKEDIPYGQLKDYLLATAYLPVFKHEKLGGKLYLDGAFYDNLPFRMLKNKGYDKLILVRTNALGLTRRIDRDDENIIIISPSDDIGGTYSFEPDICKRNMELGYYDALRVFRRLKGRRYYIMPKGDKDYYFNLLSNMDEGRIEDIRKLLHISDGKRGKRLLFEIIIPKLGSLLGLNKDFDYEDLLIALLDIKAEELGIERFKVYSFEELLGLVINTKPPVKPKVSGRLSPIEKIFERVDISYIFNKEETLLRVADIIFINMKSEVRTC